MSIQTAKSPPPHQPPAKSEPPTAATGLRSTFELSPAPRRESTAPHGGLKDVQYPSLVMVSVMRLRLSSCFRRPMAPMTSVYITKPEKKVSLTKSSTSPLAASRKPLEGEGEGAGGTAAASRSPEWLAPNQRASRSVHTGGVGDALTSCVVTAT